MAHFHNGYENIKVRLIAFKGNDLAKEVYNFNKYAEFNEATFGEYSPENPEAIRIIDEIVTGKTFPKYALEGQNLAFQIENISRINLAQLTRERGFFCSASGDVRPLTQDFIVPRYVYKNPEWMAKIEAAQKLLEDVYIDMCEAGVTYMESRYFGLHSQTISLTYNASFSDWARSCNTRTENNFADEINYMYRLMRYEVRKAIDAVTDPLSKKLYEWMFAFTDRKTWYKRDHTYNNDFARYPTPEGYEFSEPAHNDWRKSSWKLELEEMYKHHPELLLEGEKEMIEKWMAAERAGEELPSTYDPEFELVAEKRIKTVDYYNR
jgi:hypothetical protein